MAHISTPLEETFWPIAPTPVHGMPRRNQNPNVCPLFSLSILGGMARLNRGEVHNGQSKLPSEVMFQTARTVLHEIKRSHVPDICSVLCLCSTAQGDHCLLCSLTTLCKLCKEPASPKFILNFAAHLQGQLSLQSHCCSTLLHLGTLGDDATPRCHCVFCNAHTNTPHHQQLQPMCLTPRK